MTEEIKRSVTIPEQLTTALEAYRDYAQPDTLSTENVGESIDAQIAVDGYKAAVAGKKAEQIRTARNEALIDATVSALPNAFGRIDIDNAADRVLARQLQAHVIFAPYANSDRYIIGTHQRGRKTDLLLVNADRYTYHPWGKYQIATVPTRAFKAVHDAAQARLSQPLSTDEIEQMKHINALRLSARVETSMKLVAPLGDRMRDLVSGSVLAVIDGAPLNRGSQHRHEGAIPVLDDEPLNQDFRTTKVNGEGINDFVMEQFHVVDHLAQLAADFHVSDAVLKNIASLG